MTGTLKITGKLTAGSTVTVAPGTLADSNGIYNLTYEWFSKANGTTKSLSTNSSYILTAADLKTDVFVKALYVNSNGSPTESAESHIFNHAHTGSISINGAATVGNTISAVTSLKDADGLGTLTYLWTNAAGDPLGNKMTYKITANDYASGYNYINLKVSYVDKLGYAESETKFTGFISYSTKTSAANDILTSTMNLDKLTGGLGSDTFVFANAITSPNTDTNRDVITDFNHSQKDKIDLKGIDANTTNDSVTAVNDAFSTSILNAAPVLSDSLTSAAGLLWFDENTSILYGSTDADVDPEFSIQLTGVAVLEQSDITF